MFSQLKMQWFSSLRRGANTFYVEIIPNDNWDIIGLLSVNTIMIFAN